MNRNLPAFIFAAGCALSAMHPAAAQGVYRCGDSYSQKPCPGGALVSADDARSDSQRKQTLDAAQRDGKAADAMEKARLKEEAKPVQAYLPPPTAEPATEENKPGAAVKPKKPKKPQYFTAAAPRKPGEAAARKKTKAKKKDDPAAKKNDA
jgi:hypothetical protein